MNISLPTKLDRQSMAALIDHAQDIPVQWRVTARLFLARMTDKDIADMATKAQSVLDNMTQGDRLAFEKSLVNLGLPGSFVSFLSSKAFSSGAGNIQVH